MVPKAKVKTGALRRGKVKRQSQYPRGNEAREARKGSSGVAGGAGAGDVLCFCDIVPTAGLRHVCADLRRD